jgi:chaperone BCS1
MIKTTNHYNKLDPALVRPGRIDIALNLGNASRNTICEMYEHYYGHSIPENMVEKIPDKLHSPAQIINYYVSNHDNPDGFLCNLWRDTSEL